MDSAICNVVARHEALALQRSKQQGLGRPIVSTEFKGARFVAVKNRLLRSKTWRTFHDFLSDYIKIVLGPEWGNEQLRIERVESRHPILIWYDKLARLQKQYFKEAGRIYTTPMTGAVVAYYRLAYDLYCLDHNAEVQSTLVARLKNKDHFYSAQYEVFVAATLIRAGFAIEFEDESRRGSTHCEFAATSRRTGRRFSVECKHREASMSDGQPKLAKLGRTLRNALLKTANHTRIVFIDLNFPHVAISPANLPNAMTLALGHIRKFEQNVKNGADLPPAYLFLTNYPYHRHPEEINVVTTFVADGFKIPEFKHDRPTTLHEAIVNREVHRDMHDLLKSIRQHSGIPSTFDGDIPEFAFGDASQRLEIGRHYLVKDSENKDRVCVLTSATVNESERKAYCAVTFESGESAILTWSLSDAEMAAYREHPETFFGVVAHQQHAETPLDLYDFILESYKATPKERLLAFMANAPDFEQLKDMTQEELSKVYAERCAGAIVSRQKPGPNPPAK